MSAEHDDLTVTYSVKDLLSALKSDVAAGFAKMEVALNGKADKADIAQINGRLDEHQKQIDELRKKQDKDDAAHAAAQEVRQSHTEWKRWAIPTALTVVWIVIALFQAGVFK